ncbi:MAG: tyrosine--tRNA ligase [Phycisphaera sp.]|nr:MAG: tyrosine--tRNA ligase [Phycisphaera sp.]
MDLLDELTWRGLLHQSTDEAGLRDHLKNPNSTPRRIYAGFDPTADSLTIGNLVPIMLLKHIQRAGHDPIVVMGGGTGLIGDPSGKSAERQLMTAETVACNIEKQRPIFSCILGGDSTILNNADWLTKISFIDALRDIGKYFSVNMMMQKDSVRSRLQDREQGITYTEFSYMILQAYDFTHLYKDEGVSVQCGGSDQYGNIVAGTDLIRRKVAASFAASAFQDPQNPDLKQLQTAAGVSTKILKAAFGFTAPLVTKTDGTKFGKTESGAIWLTAKRTSPYAYYQFWLNASDCDVGRFLRTFTLLDRQEIERLEAEVAANPAVREAQKALAYEATSLLHGKAEADAAIQASKALFADNIASLPEATLLQVLADVPTSRHDISKLDGGISLVELLIETELAKSKRQAREFLCAGSVNVNGTKANIDTCLSRDDLLHNSLIAIRRGKKNRHLTIWE